MNHEHTLQIENSMLLIVDVQEGFRDAMGNFSVLAANIARAVSGAQLLGVPVIVTEQYPKGLGPTAEEIRYSLPHDLEAIEKLEFSSFGSVNFRQHLEKVGRKQVILCGIETHICVNQTAHDLIANGYDVHLLTDCVGSRFEHDKAAGLAKMNASGVIPSSVELAMFELMVSARHEKFKEMQALVK
jgi:nicotinamidase-related amidase